VGIGRAQVKKRTDALAEKRGAELEAASIEHVTRQLATFKSKLEMFAKEHRDEIKRNPVFRQQFQDMCQKVGVDPLASHKGFWAQLLGVGDFYYELAVQAIDVCISTRSQNGGLISMDELIRRLRAKRGSHSQPISINDVSQSVSKVSCLGNGFQILKIGQKTMVVSVPVELNRDHTSVITHAQQQGGHFSVPGTFQSRCVDCLLLMIEGSFFVLGACAGLNWANARLKSVLDLLLEEGMVWVDNQGDTPEYWFPSLFENFSTM
jgi:ESCRT-II complex subunit VPS22